MKVHKVYWWSNQRTKSPIIFAGEVSQCGAKWVIGSSEWKYVKCKRCLKARKRGRG